MLSLMAQRSSLMTRLTPATTAPARPLRLGRWDFRMDRDKVEPLLFTAHASYAGSVGSVWRGRVGLLGFEAAGDGSRIDRSRGLV
jgi:hypothetical protein